MDRERLLSPRRITAVYLAFGVVWIASTDWLVVTLVDDASTVTTLQTLKGWVFVGLSSLLIFGLTRFRQRQIERSQAQLHTATEQLQVLTRVLRHNIRNDLNVIQGYIETVQEQVREVTYQRNLMIARRTAEEVSMLSEKIKVVNEVDLDPSTEAQIDLRSLVDDEVASIRRHHPDLTVSVECPDSALVLGDSTLGYAIREVLDNAIEHNTNPPGEREIEIKVVRERGWIDLVVADNGPSIPDDELAPLRAGEETDLLHTSGIGLWLVTWVSQCYGGEVDFDTDSGTGTTVTLRFRAASSMSTVGRVIDGDEHPTVATV